MFGPEITEVDDKVVVGNKRNAWQLQKLQYTYKITHVLCVTDSTRFPQEDYPFQWEFVPLNDWGKTDLQKPLERCGAVLTQVLATENARVFVHCNEGVNRAPTVVLYYLSVIKGMDFLQAWRLLRELRPIVSPHPNYFTHLCRINNAEYMGRTTGL
eukprot:GFYU01003934.1.p1 GENE.GFYU01003934.1~~GFYU01003934.1.p1  ORF type:complete len:156 (+),score=36.25 GFYU01003934.1:65-532(+)